MAAFASLRFGSARAFGQSRTGATTGDASAGQTIADSYLDVPQDAEDDALALTNAMALTEAEPW